MSRALPILLATVVAAALALVPATAALAQDRAVDDAAAALRTDPVYVDPAAERALTDAQAEQLRERIRSADAGPLFLAILPTAAADAAGGDPDLVLERLAGAVGERGTYVALVGGSLRAGATRGVLPRGLAGRLAADALQARRDEGTLPVLLDLVERIGQARAGNVPAGAGGGRGGGGGISGVAALVPLLLLLGLPALLVFSGRRRQRRETARELEEVKDFARDDLVALGDDIRALDLDVEMPGVSQETREDYSRALDRYERADLAWRRAQHPEDLEEVASLLEDGRHAIASVRARLEDRPVPERRPPCFFDPRHGPSVEDIEWAPPGGAPRPVPVCAADAVRIRDGLDPAVRTVHGVPYYDAGPQYAPWATGFFGGGLLPGLFVGSMLGGMAWPGAAFGSGFGGGLGADPGDFGGGLDFGGGDFGGGFGGGGDF